MRGHCSVVESYDCEAPAGISAGGRSASLPQKTGLLRCGYCWEPVCSKCSSEVEGKPVCLSHTPEELYDWLGLP